MTRLIDAEALKERLNEIFDISCGVVSFDDIIATVDNAPTFEMPNWYKVYEDVKSTFEKYQSTQIAWEQGYEAGVAQGKSERPQGDLISREALIQAVEQGEGISWDSHGKDDLCVRKKYIENAPTVEIPNYGGQVVPDSLQGWRYEEIDKDEIQKSVHLKCCPYVNNCPKEERGQRNDTRRKR